MSYSQTLTMDAGPNIRSQDVRYRRVGGDQPYRDDPNAPSSHPSPLDYGMDNDDDNYKPNHNPGLRQCLDWCCAVPAPTNHAQFYMDDFNDLPWTCQLGTSDEDGIWLNQGDPAGTVMAFTVSLLLTYSALTIAWMAQAGGLPNWVSFLYSLVCALAIASHVKTTLTDPGSVPPSAVPTEAQRRNDKLSMCSQCQTFKPPLSHHCRICNRCISRMDHHCPWMNNCVGAGNMKHFFLFLIYTWSCSTMALILLGWNYFFCSQEQCSFNIVLVTLVRCMTVLAIGTFLFTSSMLMNVIYGLITGIGTIDRLKKKATNTMNDSEEEPVPLKDVFGMGPLWTWALPMDPLFDDYDRVMGYSTPQRLLREQILREQRSDASVVDSYTSTSV
eukprot:Nitzschia sp. Nitz4//scaffold73_size107353//60799//62213//NITZ4_004322-RA/size107353-snap-gene-0.94-mRNA-1//1//CDS//3329557482//6362//frame0